MSKQIPLVEALRRKIPEEAVESIAWHIRNGRVQLRIARSRTSKLGDFSPARLDKPHRISVNGDLNPYQFLWTLVHELAHLYTWNEHGRKVDPHGREWQATFAKLMAPYLDNSIFPEVLRRKLSSHLQSAAASTCSDPDLYKLFSSYDEQPKFYVDEIPMGGEFALVGGRRFRKGKKLRKRYECTSLDNGRTYLVHGHAEVDLDALVSA